MAVQAGNVKPQRWALRGSGLVAPEWQPLWHTFYHGAPLWGRHGPRKDVVRDGTFTPQNSPTWTATPLGGGVNFVRSSSQRLALDDRSWGNRLLPFGGVTFVYRSSNTTDIMTLSGCFNDGENLGFHLSLNSDESNNLDAGKVHGFVRQDGSSASDFIRVATTNDVAATDGNMHVLTVQWDGPNATLQIVLDGVDRAVTVDIATAQSGDTGWGYDVTVGARNVRGTPDRHLDGDIVLAIFHDLDGLMPLQQIEAWHRDPFGPLTMAALSPAIIDDVIAAAADVALSGTSSATAATQAGAGVDTAVSGSLAATATTDPSLGLARPIAGTSPAASDHSAALSVARTVAGTSAATADHSAELTLQTDIELAGTSPATSTTTALLEMDWALASTVPATSSTEATALRVAGLASTAAATSDHAATLTVTVAGQVALSGSLDATSDHFGALGLDRPVSATVAATASHAVTLTDSGEAPLPTPSPPASPAARETIAGFPPSLDVPVVLQADFRIHLVPRWRVQATLELQPPVETQRLPMFRVRAPLAALAPPMRTACVEGRMTPTVSTEVEMVCPFRIDDDALCTMVSASEQDASRLLMPVVLRGLLEKDANSEQEAHRQRLISYYKLLGI